jgi:hypothetical protein
VVMEIWKCMRIAKNVSACIWGRWYSAEALAEQRVAPLCYEFGRVQTIATEVRKQCALSTRWRTTTPPRRCQNLPQWSPTWLIDKTKGQYPVSPTLTWFNPPDFYLWGSLKDVVYCIKPPTLKTLWEEIGTSCASNPVDILTTAARALVHRTNGGHWTLIQV